MLATLMAPNRGQRLGERAEELARRLERTSEEFVRAVERYPREGWQRRDFAQSWWAVAEARHVAERHLPLARFVEAVATCRPLPALQGECDEERGGRTESVGKAETLNRLRTNGALAAAIIRDLGDEQLERSTSYFGTKLSARQLVEELLIAHIEEHRSGIG